MSTSAARTGESPAQGPARRPNADRFDPAELSGLPEPVRRYFATAIAPGTPLATTAQLRMRGRIRIGRWLPFRADERLTPLEGFVWTARAAGVVTGSDRCADGVGVADWRLAGLLPVMHAAGPDVSRSSGGRAGAEGIWVPTALLPRYGVRWSAEAWDRVTARYRTGTVPVRLRLRLDEVGRITTFVFDRWGDPDRTGAWTWQPFGGETTGHRTFDGVTIPSSGRIGWFFGTDRWAAGEFFRYRITDLHLIACGGLREARRERGGGPRRRRHAAGPS
jgi:hypothetical protein